MTNDTTHLNCNESTLDLLLSRRSLVALNMSTPGPTAEELDKILTAGARVPDHGRIEPWRIQIIDTAGRSRLVDTQTRIFQIDFPNELPRKLEVLNKITESAPTLLVVTSYPDSSRYGKVPLIEQQLSGGALCQNILLAAHAMGYVAQWITGWPAYHKEIKALLGHEESTDILGFIFIGSAGVTPFERQRPDMESIVSHWP